MDDFAVYEGIHVIHPQQMVMRDARGAVLPECVLTAKYRRFPAASRA